MHPLVPDNELDNLSSTVFIPTQYTNLPDGHPEGTTKEQTRSMRDESQLPDKV
jgi:hypothetical protein